MHCCLFCRSTDALTRVFDKNSILFFVSTFIRETILLIFTREDELIFFPNTLCIKTNDLFIRNLRYLSANDVYHNNSFEDVGKNEHGTGSAVHPIGWDLTIV